MCGPDASGWMAGMGGASNVSRVLWLIPAQPELKSATASNSTQFLFSFRIDFLYFFPGLVVQLVAPDKGTQIGNPLALPVGVPENKNNEQHRAADQVEGHQWYSQAAMPQPTRNATR